MALFTSERIESSVSPLPTSMDPNGFHMQSAPSQQAHLQRAAPTQLDDQLQAKVFDEIRKRPVVNGGWQQAVDPRERVALVMQLLNSLRQMNPDLSACLRIALVYETQSLMQSSSREVWHNAIRHKLNQMAQARQQQQQQSNMSLSMPQQTQQMPPQMMQQPQAPQSFGMNMDPMAFQQQQQQQQQVQPQHMPQQQQMSSFPSQQSQLQPQQHMLSQASQISGEKSMPAAVVAQSIKVQVASIAAHLTLSDQQQIMHDAFQLFQSTTKEQHAVTRQGILSKMRPEQREAFQRSGQDPLFRHLAGVAVRHFEMQRGPAGLQTPQQQQQQMQQQNLGKALPPTSMQRQTSQATAAQTINNGQAVDFSSLLGQQADALKMQESGQLVVPASNNNNSMQNNVANNQLPTNGNMTPAQMQQIMAQRQMQQRAQQMNAQGQPTSQPQMRVPSQMNNQNMSQIGMQNNMTPQQQAQLRAQASNMVQGQPATQSSPAMSMLTRPMAPPAQRQQSQQAPQGQGTPQMSAQAMVPQPSNGQAQNMFSQQSQQTTPAKTPQYMQPQMQQGQVPTNMLGGQMMPQQTMSVQPSNTNALQAPPGMTPEQSRMFLQVRFREFDVSQLPPVALRELGPIPQGIQTWAQLKAHYEQIGARDQLERVKQIQFVNFRNQHAANNNTMQRGAAAQNMPQVNNALQMQSNPQGMNAQQMTFQNKGAQAAVLGMSSAISNLPMLEPTAQELQLLRAQHAQQNLSPEEIRNMAIVNKISQVKANPQLWQQAQQQMAMMNQANSDSRMQNAQPQPQMPQAMAQNQAQLSNMSQMNMMPNQNVNGMQAQRPHQQQASQSQATGTQPPTQIDAVRSTGPGQVNGMQPNGSVQVTDQIKTRISQLVVESETAIRKGPAEAISDPSDLQLRVTKLQQLLPLIGQLERMAPFIMQALGENALRQVLERRAMILQQMSKDGNVNGYISLSHAAIDDHGNQLKRFVKAVTMKYTERVGMLNQQVQPQAQQEQPTTQATSAQQATAAATATAGAAAKKSQTSPQKPTKATKTPAAVKKASVAKAAVAPTNEQSVVGMGTSPHGVPVYDGGKSGSIADKLHIPAKKKQKTAAGAMNKTGGTPVVTPAAQVVTPAAMAASPDPSAKTDSVQKRPQTIATESAKEVDRRFKCRDEACSQSLTGYETEAELKRHCDTAHQPVSDPLQYLLTSAAAYYRIDKRGVALPGTSGPGLILPGRPDVAKAGAIAVKRDASVLDKTKAVATPASTSAQTLAATKTNVKSDQKPGQESDKKPDGTVVETQTLAEAIAARSGLEPETDDGKAADNKDSTDDTMASLFGDFEGSLFNDTDLDINNMPAGLDLTKGMSSPQLLTPTPSEELYLEETEGAGDADAEPELHPNDAYQKAFGWVPGGPNDLELKSRKRLGLTPDTSKQASPVEGDEYRPELTWDNLFGALQGNNAQKEDWSNPDTSIFDLDWVDETLTNDAMMTT